VATLRQGAIDSASGPVLAIMYRSRNVPQAVMNLILNNGIEGQRHIETMMTHPHVLNRAGKWYQKSLDAR